MTTWREVPVRREVATASAVSRWAARLAPFAVALALAGLGRTVPAVIVGLVATTMLALSRWRPAAAAVVDRGVAATARLLAHVVSTALLAVVQVLVIMPFSALSRLARRDPLRGAGAWRPRAATASSTARRTFGPEEVVPRSSSPIARAVRLVPRAVGTVLLVLLVNYGLGWTWDEYIGSHDDPPSTVMAVGPSRDLRDAPAMSDEPWADDWWDEYDGLRYGFVPYLLSRVEDVDGPMISSQGGLRSSYEPAGEQVADVWLLGGGAAWGVGQRDEHTIASELARIAEDEDRPVRVWNFAQPGYTSWQSALLFEQLLAVRPAPDAVVLYDGADDVAVQVETPSDRPSHYNLADIRHAITGRDSAREQVDGLWEEYRDTSVLTRLAEGLGGLFASQPAWADEDLEGRVRRLHGESVDLIAGLAADHGVRPVFVWQAATAVAGDGGAYRSLASSDDTAIDLSRLLDDADDHVVDGVVTDEVGARLVAEALWPHLGDELG